MNEVEVLLEERPGRLHRAVACELHEEDGILLNSGVVLNTYSWDRYSMEEVTYPVLQRPRLFTPVNKRAFKQGYHSNDKFPFYLGPHFDGYTVDMVLPVTTNNKWRFIFQSRFSSVVNKLRLEFMRTGRFKSLPLYVCDRLGFEQLSIWDWNLVLEYISRAIFDVFSIVYVVQNGVCEQPISLDPTEPITVTLFKFPESVRYKLYRIISGSKQRINPEILSLIVRARAFDPKTFTDWCDMVMQSNMDESVRKMIVDSARIHVLRQNVTFRDGEVQNSEEFELFVSGCELPDYVLDWS